MDMQALTDRLNEAGIQYQKDVPLSELTSFRIGGPCPLVVFCSLENQLEDAAAIFRDNHTDFLVIGGGTNILVSDNGLTFPIIRFWDQDVNVTCLQKQIIAPASARLDHVVQIAAEHGLKGINFASGIPGTIGGAVTGNAGAFGSQIGDCVAKATILTPEGDRESLSRAELKFSYRDSLLKHTRNVLLSVVLELEPCDPGSLLKEREGILALRREKHPDYHQEPCAGSFFKNIVQPNGVRQAAGWFLDRAGCKGLAVGDAAVFEKHANIIINRGRATAEDVLTLAAQMKARVEEMFGFELEPEVRLIGMDG